MAFQSTVYSQQGFGVVGEIFDNGPVRAEPFIINSASAANNVFGRAFSITAEVVVSAGNPSGNKVFAGILINPKGSSSNGTTSSPLAATLTLPNYSIGEICNMGSIVVTLGAAANIGDLVIFDNTTGVLETIAPGADLPSGKSPAYAVVDRFTQGLSSPGGLAVIRVTTTPEIPVAA